MKIADGKHFLDFSIERCGINARIICRADPQNDPEAACAYGDGPHRDCLVEFAWSNLGADMLDTPHHAIEKVRVWATPLPIVYEGEGYGEDYEDWIRPDTDHPTYPKQIADAREAAEAQPL